MSGIRYRLIAALTFAAILIACGGGSDPTATSQPEPEPTSTATTAPAPQPAAPTATEAQATATTAPEPTATSTAAPTNTPRPIATKAPMATATVEPTATPDTVAERGDGLLLALVDERSLPDGWAILDTSVQFAPGEDETTVCDLHEFAGRADLIVEASVELESADGMGYFQQSITEYQMLAAFQTLGFVSDQVNECPEWQSPDGLTFQIEPILMGLPVSDGLSYRLRFVFDEQQFEGRWIFMRVNTFISTIVYFAPEGADLAEMEPAVFDSFARLNIVSDAINEVVAYEDVALSAHMAAQLISRAEVLQLPEAWSEFGIMRPDDPQRYDVCGLDLFTEQFGALEELQNEFRVDFDLGPFLWQSISTFPDEQTATESMAHIRETVSCAEYADDAGNVTLVLDYPDVGLGDESHAALVSIDGGQIGIVYGEFVFLRVGAQITVIIFVIVDETIDQAHLLNIAGMAVTEIERLSR